MYSVLLVAAAAVLPYANALGNGFVWDDVYLVVKNPYIKGLHNIGHLFTTGYWESIGKSGGLYRPLTMLSFLVEHSLAALNPFIFHLDNILLHAACSLAVYLTAREIMEHRHAPLLAAMLYAVHPVHSEAVASVYGRAELLATLFFLLAFLAYIRQWGGRWWSLVSPGLFLIGMLAKETAAVLPAVIFLYMLLIGKERSPSAFIRALAPYAAALAVYLSLRMAVLGGYAGPGQSEQAFANVKSFYILLAMAKAWLHYIRLSLFPTGLQAVYMFPPPDSILDPSVMLFLVILAIALWLAYWCRSTRPVVTLLILWFAVCLLPVSNIVPTEIIMSERALYLPSVGVCVLVGYVIAGVMSLADNKRQAAWLIPAGSVIVITLAFAALSFERSPVWEDDASFAAERVRVHTGIAQRFPVYTLNSLRLADAFAQHGQPERSLAVLARAVELDPGNVDARLKLAAALKDKGELEAALEQLTEAGKIPGLNLDRVYTDIATIYYMTGNTGKAESYLELALDKNPAGPLQNLNYGILLLEKGEVDAALARFTRAAELDPNLYAALYHKGLLLGEMGDFAGAVTALRKASDIEPGSPEARLYLAAAYAALGQHSDARRELMEALRIRPGYSEAEALLDSIR